MRSVHVLWAESSFYICTILIVPISFNTFESTFSISIKFVSMPYLYLYITCTYTVTFVFTLYLLFLYCAVLRKGKQWLFLCGSTRYLNKERCMQYGWRCVYARSALSKIKTFADLVWLWKMSCATAVYFLTLLKPLLCLYYFCICQKKYKYCNIFTSVHF